MLSFKDINDRLQRIGTQVVSDRTKKMYILSALTGLYSLEMIDFTKIDLAELTQLQENIYDIIIHDDDNAESDIFLNPAHDYSKLLEIEHLIIDFGAMKKKQPKSPFRFL